MRSHPQTALLNVVVLFSLLLILVGATIAVAQPYELPEGQTDLSIVLELPSEEDAQQYLNVSISAERSAAALGVSPAPVVQSGFLAGCVSELAGGCDRTWQIDLDEPAIEELTAALAEIDAIPRCEPEARFPGDVEFHLQTAGLTLVGYLPTDASAVEGRLEGPCRAGARLVWWVVEKANLTSAFATEVDNLE